MRIRSAFYASVCSALLAAVAAVPASHAAQSPAVTLTETAYQALSNGDAKAAIASYSEAIESRELPANVLANALLNRGLAYQQLGQHQDGIDDYSAALRIDALSAKLRATALFNRGLAYQKVKRPALAIEDFTSALFLDAEFPHAYYLRGQALREAGQFLFALSDFEKALRYKHPNPHLVRMGEALTYEKLRRHELAAKAVAQALALKPDYAPALKLQAELADKPHEDQKKVADGLVTGSISKGAPDQVVAKDALPAAVAPPAELVEGTAPAAKKLYTDRVPEADTVIVPAYALAAPQKAVKKAEIAEAEPPVPQPAEEKVAEAAPAAEAIEEAPAQPEVSGYTIQLSSAVGEDLAWGTWKKLKARHKLLEDQKPVVVKADLGKKGVFYRLRLAGFEDQGSAKAVCSKLKSKGLSCFVSKASS